MIFGMNSDTRAAKPTAVPASVGWRLLALLYDAVIAIALLFAVSALSLALMPGHRPVTPGSAASYLVFAGIWAAFGAYAVLSWRYGGQTIGMKPWRLRVVDGEGAPPAWRPLLIRYAVASVSLGTALLWCVFDQHRRGLHELAAGTLLVRIQPRSASPDSPNTARTP